LELPDLGLELHDLISGARSTGAPPPGPDPPSTRGEEPPGAYGANQESKTWLPPIRAPRMAPKTLIHFN
jgi:hypothetical protein